MVRAERQLVCGGKRQWQDSAARKSSLISAHFAKRRTHVNIFIPFQCNTTVATASFFPTLYHELQYYISLLAIDVHFASQFLFGDEHTLRCRAAPTT